MKRGVGHDATAVYRVAIVGGQGVVGSDSADTAVGAEVLVLAGDVLRVHAAGNLGHMTGQASARTRGARGQNNGDLLVTVQCWKLGESRARKTQRGIAGGCLGTLWAGGYDHLPFVHVIGIDREGAGGSLYRRM